MIATRSLCQIPCLHTCSRLWECLAGQQVVSLGHSRGWWWVVAEACERGELQKHQTGCSLIGLSHAILLYWFRLPFLGLLRLSWQFPLRLCSRDLLGHHPGYKGHGVLPASRVAIFAVVALTSLLLAFRSCM